MPRKISAKKIKDLCNIALDDLKAVDINAFDVEKHHRLPATFYWLLEHQIDMLNH